MASEAQQYLAHKIAIAGIWPYAKTIELMEKQDGFVAYLKETLDAMQYAMNSELIERAYCYARFAEQIEASSFGRAFMYYMCRSDQKIKRYVTDIPAKIKEKSHGAKITQDLQGKYLAEREEYNQKRYEKCTQNDPFLAE